MKRSRTWLFLCAAILVAGMVGCFWVMRPSTAKTVEILQDGNVLYTFDLSRTEDQVIEVFYQNRSNTVQIQDGKICVQAAECLDETCGVYCNHCQPCPAELNVGLINKYYDLVKAEEKGQ